MRIQSVPAPRPPLIGVAADPSPSRHRLAAALPPLDFPKRGPPRWLGHHRPPPRRLPRPRGRRQPPPGPGGHRRHPPRSRRPHLQGRRPRKGRPARHQRYAPPDRAPLLAYTPSPLADSRSFLTASYRSLLRTYILSPPTAPPPPPLLALLSSPRVHLLDLSYLDDASGATLLHEAARRKDLSLIELAVRGGADIFVRDRRGRPLHDVVGKDDKVRAFLRQCKSRLAPRVLAPSCSPPLPPPKSRTSTGR